MASKFHWFFFPTKNPSPSRRFGSPGIEYIKPRRLKPEGRCFFFWPSQRYTTRFFTPKKFLVMSFSCQEGGTLSDIMNDIISHWEVNKMGFLCFFVEKMNWMLPKIGDVFNGVVLSNRFRLTQAGCSRC